MTRQEMAARRKRRRIRLVIRNTAGFFSAIAFFGMIGSVGAVELDMVPLLEGAIRMFGFLFLWGGMLFLAGAFQPVRKERRKSHEVHRDPVTCSDRTGCKKSNSSW